MPKKNHSWGIEIGSNAIKAVHLVRHGLEVVLDDYDVVPFKKVLTTPDLDVNEAIRLGLSKLLSNHEMRHSKVVVSVPGSAAFAKFAKLPPVDPKKIIDIVKFEAVQQIPFPIDEVEWDYQVFTQPDSPDVEVGIFAITKQRVGEFLDHFKGVALSVDGLTLSALAVYNAMAYDMDLTPESPGMIIMDIGTLNTDIIIVHNGNLWLRTLPIGGNNFTEALVRAFKLSYAKAEKLKREAGTSKYSRQIFQAMRPVFSDLIQEIQRTLAFFQSQDHEAQVTRLIGVGSTFRLPGMQKFLRQQMQIDVKRLDEFKRINLEHERKAAEFSDLSVNLATAYGLALQGVGLERVHANILPIRNVKQRVWKMKQPWFAAAALFVLAATAAAWVRLEVGKSEFRSAVQENTPRIEMTIGRATRYVKSWREMEGGADPRRQIENLRRILDYRDVWPKLMQDITYALRSMGGQPELLVADYEAIQAIPRPERRRIYIDSIEAEYRFGADGTGAAPTRPGRQPQRRTIEDIWGRQKGENGAGRNKPGRAQASGEGLEGVHQPPAFIVKVKGTTPYHDGPKFISQYFIKWLQDNSRRPNRPYRISVTKRALRRIEKVRQPEAGTRGRGRAARPSLAGSQRQTGDKNSLSGGFNLDQLLPKHPLAHETQEGDWSFEIEWSIELLRPEEARQAEESS